MTREIVITSGMRPTGSFHLGNYLGALANWLELQREYECYFFVVDWHALTDAENTLTLREDILNLAIDWLSCGLDPNRDGTAIFVQSAIKELTELHLLLSMSTPVSWLTRVPTYKERLDAQGIQEPGYGLLGYPVLMAADILIYGGTHVPVGEDQRPHINLTRDIAQRFNNQYGGVFTPLPGILVTAQKRIPGTDWKKMSKRYGNSIEISMTDDETLEKVMEMFTDPLKLRRGDRGHPIRVVYTVPQLAGLIAGEEGDRTRLAGASATDWATALSELSQFYLADIEAGLQRYLKGDTITPEGFAEFEKGFETSITGMTKYSDQPIPIDLGLSSLSVELRPRDLRQYIEQNSLWNRPVLELALRLLDLGEQYVEPIARSLQERVPDEHAADLPYAGLGLQTISREELAEIEKQRGNEPLVLNPGCVVYALHETFSPDYIHAIRKTCEDGSRGCVDCKRELAERINNSMREIRRRRADLLKDPGYVTQVLAQGAEKARSKAQEIMHQVRMAMRMYT